MYKIKLLLTILTTFLNLSACTLLDNISPTTTLKTQHSLTSIVPSFPALVRPYEVVGRANVSVTTSQRKIGVWHITSSAETPDEWAQTAIQATVDLYRQYGMDYTEVLLVPNKHLVYSGLYYAQVSYAADGKGSFGLDGADLVYYEWDVRVANRPLTNTEIAIAEMWVEKFDDFPNLDLWSSSLCDIESLRKYISETLNIEYEYTEYPVLVLTMYGQLP